ncbi:MAG: aldehyde dehydrogenase, partial [Alphaproteobacteria bacterium]
AMARAAGFPVTALARDGDGLDSAVRLLRDAPGPVFVTIKVRAETPPLVLLPQDGVELKDRFRTALLGAP